MTFIFDLDGTLANIDHRLHFLEKKDWDGFFQACDQDLPVQSVIDTLKALCNSGEEVQIWSGRSAVVYEKTCEWLDKHIGYLGYYGQFGSVLLEHMRKEGDYRPDTVVKEEWLYQFHQERGRMPTIIFDDRPSVVDMWRKNGVTCAQVATWDDRRMTIKSNPKHGNALLNLLIGPSGAGKSTFAKENFNPSWIISSDQIREDLCGDFKDQSRNNEVFKVLHTLVETRLKCGLPVVVDATNLHAKDRKAFVEIAKAIDKNMIINYYVIDRSLEEKKKSGDWRNQVMKGNKTLVEYHHDVFQQNKNSILNGDNLNNVVVYS